MSSYIFIPGMVLMFMILMVLIFHYSFKDYERLTSIFTIVHILIALLVSFLWPIILPMAVISMFSYFLYKKLKPFLERHL